MGRERRGGDNVHSWTTVAARRHRHPLRRVHQRRRRTTAPRAQRPQARGRGRGARVRGHRPVRAAAAAPIAGGLLDKVLKAGKLVVSTDPDYPPQSALKPDGTFEGFDIDVANEIAKRLGVEVEFETPDLAVITAGSWAGRWDVSVGSMTITSERQKCSTSATRTTTRPAQMAASTASGITTLDGLAGKTVCVGEATTYLDWLNGRRSTSAPLSPTDDAARRRQGRPRSEDRRRLRALWEAGRNDFEGWLSSSTTVEAAIKDGLPMVKVGDPVFYEPLAVATDKARSGSDATASPRSTRSSRTCTPTAR